MKVLYALSDMEIELSENYVATLYIENMLYFRRRNNNWIVKKMLFL